MTAVREAIVLPLLFLTVVLLGGLRVAGEVRFVDPPLLALVLGLLVIASLVRAHVVSPDVLMRAERGALANVSGAVVLLTLYAASVQVFHLVTPERGLLHVIFGAFFFVQLLTTMAGGTGRVGFLRSLTVLLGSAFLLRWVVLEALYATDSGLLKRVFTAVAEGVTLGALEYAPHDPFTGYTAFFAIALYLAGLALLPAPRRGVPGLVHAPAGPRELIVPLMLAAFLLPGCSAAATDAPVSTAGGDAAAEREDALRRARVWRPPAVPVELAALDSNPEGTFAPDEIVECTFVRRDVGGTTPKFYCETAAGDVYKVKYGVNNPELAAEVAATRLLAALGFGADRMLAVRGVRCHGCPRFPFQALRCHERFGVDLCLSGAGVRLFSPAVIESRLPGRTIEAVEDQGWRWDELPSIDPAAGGSPPDHVDAFRLVAVLLAHWDNKGTNQRLTCPDDGRPCRQPLAMMQDVGATFGPNKIDLTNWSRSPVWADRAACTISMRRLPWGGATFPDHQVSEAGRQFAAGLLERLTERQLIALFSSSGVTAHHQVNARAADPRIWAQVFLAKVHEIASGPPCPR